MYGCICSDSSNRHSDAESINTLSNTLVIAGTERLSSRVLQSNFHIMPGESLLPGNSISMVRLTWHDELCLHSSVGLMAAEDALSHPHERFALRVVQGIIGNGMIRG